MTDEKLKETLSEIYVSINETKGLIDAIKDGLTTYTLRVMTIRAGGDLYLAKKKIEELLSEEDGNE